MHTSIKLELPESLSLKLDSLLNEVKDLKENFLPHQSTEPNYIPRLKLAERLQISIGTLHNWTSKGILKAHQIGGKIYYKADEVNAAMIELK